MKCGDLGRRLLVGQRPQDADTFHRREREVEPGHGLPNLVAFAVDPGYDVLAGGVFVAELFGVERPANLLGDFASLGCGGATFLGFEECTLGGGDRVQDVDATGIEPEGSAELAVGQCGPGEHLLVGVRVQTLAIQCGHLRFGDDCSCGRGFRSQTVES